MSISNFNEVFTNRDLSEIIFKKKKDIVEEMNIKEKINQYKELGEKIEMVYLSKFNTKKAGYEKRIDYYYDVKKYIDLFIDICKISYKKGQINSNIIVNDKSGIYRIEIDKYFYCVSEIIKFWKFPKYFKKKHFDNFCDLDSYIRIKTKY